MGFIFTFKDGYQESRWVSDETLATHIKKLLRKKKTVLTDLIFLPNNGATRWYRVSHSLVDRELTEPDVAFIGAAAETTFDAQKSAAEQAWENAQNEAKRKAAEMRRTTTRKIKWTDLTARQKTRLEGINLSHNECWLWKPQRVPAHEHKIYDAPYRGFFIELRGPVPKHVCLRHRCDNRRCMNPNHLVPGTHKENVRDMMRRGRHAGQRYIARRAIQKIRRTLIKQKNAHDLVWTPKRLEQLYLLSRRRYSSVTIATIIGAGITAKGVETQWQLLKAEMRGILRREKERLRKLQLAAWENPMRANHGKKTRGLAFGI